MEKHTHGVATLLFASTSPPPSDADVTVFLGLVCVFVGVATLLFARTSPPPSDADVTVFIERQRHEIRSFSARLTPVQRERLKSHVEFYSDEIAK